MTTYLVLMTRSVRAALPLRRFLGAALDVVVVEELAALIAAVTLVDVPSPSAFGALVTTLVPSATSRRLVARGAPVTITCHCAPRAMTPGLVRALHLACCASSMLMLTLLLRPQLHLRHTPTLSHLLHPPPLLQRLMRPTCLWPMPTPLLPPSLRTTVVMLSLRRMPTYAHTLRVYGYASCAVRGGRRAASFSMQREALVDSMAT